MQHTTQARYVAPGGGERIPLGPGEVLVKLPGDAARGALSVIEYEVPAGFPGPPLHVHPDFDEVFVVLEGRLTLRLGDDVVFADAGAVVYAPGDEPQTFANPGGAARLLLILAPAGFERFFRDVAAAGAGGLPDPEVVARLNREHGVRLVA